MLKNLLVSLAIFITSAAHAGQAVVLDVQAALQSSNAAEAFRADLVKSTSQQESQVRDLETQAKKMQSDFELNKGLLTQEQIQQKDLQFKKVYGEYQRQLQALQQQRAAMEKEFLEGMRPKLDQVIKALIDEGDISLIINRQSAIYVEPRIDITGEIIKRLNAQE
ncbi:OmpH family outer membrane protein [Marinobacterium sp. xm-a-152]|uniref:OmpH family outer membrane protein n=1 Tax=Marinobacterium sp. xm-a-152 TaxID=2497733 RepID=UPI0015696E4D|nr:OmpH family outer membrane protein [Marinobacterium sp. xm-a-152]NRP16179.1 Outer membrane protein (OmpH-like) [Marinobacterium sp. xm-a-152]